MHLLAVNCGSSSLKFALFETGGSALKSVGDGTVDRLRDRPVLTYTGGDGVTEERPLERPGHEVAIASVLDWLDASGRGAPDAAVHRVVHGGARHRHPARIDGEVLDAIEDAGRFARLHNAPALAAIRAAMQHTGERTSHVAVFDTAFHRTMPAHATQYAIPHELAERHGFERFGFHGIAHRDMVEAVTAIHPAGGRGLRLVTLQLGSGCSAAATRGGESIDTSMGLTPLEGLMMGTRSGDVDPALPGLLADAEGVDGDEVQRWLNERSGLLGVSGRSADVRDLLEAERDGDPRAALALEMFCARLRKQIGAYLAVLEGADAVVLGGGIGEHRAEIRRRVLEPFAWAGLHLDARRNAAADGRCTRMTADGSTIHAYVVAVDEQRAMVQEALALLA